MNSLTTLTPKQLRRAADLQERILTLRSELIGILGSPAQSAAVEAPERPKKRRMSAVGRARIAAAARARWAKTKGTASLAKPAQKAKKRRMTAAGRKALSLAAKVRWAKAKAAGKARLSQTSFRQAQCSRMGIAPISFPLLLQPIAQRAFVAALGSQLFPLPLPCPDEMFDTS
jgi:hypothetical protein